MDLNQKMFVPNPDELKQLKSLTSTLFKSQDDIKSYVEGKLAIQLLFIDYSSTIIPVNEGPPSLEFLTSVVNLNAPLQYRDPDQDFNDWESFCWKVLKL
jgi:hypothetical protein